jgi:hypothetical protein
VFVELISTKLEISGNWMVLVFQLMLCAQSVVYMSELTGPATPTNEGIIQRRKPLGIFSDGSKAALTPRNSRTEGYPVWLQNAQIVAAVMRESNIKFLLLEVYGNVQALITQRVNVGLDS